MSETAARAALPTAGTYQIDPAASRIEFRTRHMFGLGPVKGRVQVSAGEVIVGGSAPGSSVRATADADSFSTKNPLRDRRVRGRMFLDTATFPDLSFRSTAVRESGDSWVVSGLLTAKGVEAPLDLTITEVSTGGSELQISASGTVDRYQHGVKAMPGMAARRLQLTLTVIANK